jgi:hypothetical protein
MRFSTATRYSAYSVVASVFLFTFLCWLVLWALSPKERVIVQETTIIKKPVAVLPPDPWQNLREEAFANSLDAKLVIAVAKSERLIKRPKEFEGACYISDTLSTCVQSLSKTNQRLTDYLGRKPTPSEVLLAHTLGVDDALRIIRLPGSMSAKDIDEKLIKENPNIASFKTVRDFRIWLNRIVRNGAY